jgi:vitamin B12 transporter
MHLFFFFFLIFLHSYSLAAEPKQEGTLAPVVVTATRIETPLEQVTNSVSVITSDDIRSRQAETVLEVLRNVPGLDVVQTGSRGNVTSVFIRGANSNQALVLIDGVEVNGTTTGGFDFAHLTTESIERIEILRGAGGTLYGSQAVGGVINIITKRGEGAPEVNLSAEGGKFLTHRQVLGLRGGLEKFGYSLTAARIETQGFHRVNDDYRNLATSGRLDYRLTDGISLKGIFHFVNTDQGLFNNNNFIPGVVAPSARFAVSQYVAKLEWDQRLLQGWDYRISGSLFKEHDKFSKDPDAVSTTSTRNLIRPQIGTGEFQTNYRWGEWSTTTFGIEFKQRKASTSNISGGTRRAGINRAIRNMGYYLQEQIRLFDDRLILIPGVRLDDHQTFGAKWTPAFSAAYLFKETGTKIKGSYAQGFRAPTLNDLFFPSTRTGCPPFGNPDLGPERSWELDSGLEQDLFSNRIKLGATYFHREVKDLISSVPIAGCFRATNLGHARFDGGEWEVKVKILEGLSTGANYTFLTWHTQNGRLPRRPRHRASVNLDYVYERFRLNLNTNIVGWRDDFDVVTFANIRKSGYTRFDLAGSYLLPVKIPLVKSASLYGKIENLFNRRYEEADGFLARPLNFLIGIQGVFGKD